MWPWRTAPRNLELQTGDIETIYDSLGGETRRYEDEVEAYVKHRRTGGLVQAIGPAGVVGGLIGLIGCWKPSRTAGRHSGRAKFIIRGSATCSFAGVCMAGVHQGLLMYNDYNDSFLYTFGGITSSMICILGCLGSIMSPGSLALLSASLAATYVGADFGIKWYQERWLTSFFALQQQQEVPVHKITPELQPAYRSYLYWNRPAEEKELMQRRISALYVADDSKGRLDAATGLLQFRPEFWEWINFPDWWPIKTMNLTDEEWAIADRRYRAYEKRTEDLLRSNPNAFSRMLDLATKNGQK
jgi:hypothetical protein